MTANLFRCNAKGQCSTYTSHGALNLLILLFGPACFTKHPARLPYGLNICVSTSQLLNFHQTRDPGATCPPDSICVDWLPISGAWQIDYYRYPLPMRVILVAWLNDMAVWHQYLHHAIYPEI